jgi:hypothetical protein
LTASAFVVVMLPLTVIDPEVKVNLPFAIRVLFAPIRDATVKFPVRDSDVIVEVNVCVLVVPFVVGVVPLPTLNDAAVTDPAPAIKPVALAAARFGVIIFVVIVRVKVLLTVRVDPLPIVIELQVLFPSTVRVNPAPITMSSPAAGIIPPGHGALITLELQFPFPVVVTIAP